MSKNKQDDTDEWEQFDTDRANFYAQEEIRKKTPEYQFAGVLGELLFDLSQVDDGTFLSKEY